MNVLDHDRYMQRAIGLSVNSPERPFAAVIVDGGTGEVLAEGWNKSELNPTWHGEIDAINRLAELEHASRCFELVLYTTAEPCPMCQAAILWTGIQTVVFGTSIRYLQELGWKQLDIFAEEIVRRSPDFSCELIGGVCQQECNSLFEKATLSG